MKKLLVSGILLLILGMSNGFAQGINFQHISLEEALDKAEKENKLVFIDFYTTWCAPCKSLAKFVFPLKEVGDLYNKEFISIKLDAEREGAPAARKYNVSSYPTLLFLNSKGTAVYKDTGSLPTDAFIELGRKAVASVSSEYSLVKLKEEYPKRQNDEHFLKIYFNKMRDYGQSPSEGIEAWLKVQTEIEEDDVDMMEFLLENKNDLVAEGKAEEIINANFDEYMDIATRFEERRLERLKLSLVSKTLEKARQTRDPRMMQIFLEKWKALPGNDKRKSDLMAFEMEYLRMTGDKGEFSDLAQQYMEDIIAKNAPEQVKENDHKKYLAFKKDFEANPSRMGKFKLGKYEKGIDTYYLLKVINVNARTYMRFLGETKKNYKVVEDWIDYGYDLVSESNYMMDNLKSDLLSKIGKEKQALELKQLAFDHWPETDKSRSAVKRQLDQMKKSLSI
ncbi:thioredoxin family protein [Aestuariibaculum sediminum]|uniref:Thioredoxin family protein n=1 Tax=Aestuariibaculum sediminum TaxID=2770637 RepID=A0A8J6Q5F9_9FLAO|nr:thioredoxin family protein [Aestuariibaculum sediminum]MBD0830628.1 thioredoxin family protein [Aestuariibaculum sediminum]